MPNDTEHIQAALHNIDAIQYLLADSRFGDWVTTATLYTALHVVDAILFYDRKSPAKHGKTHSGRNDILKNTPRYKHICKYYMLLFRASKVARYLADDHTGTVTRFDIYMPHETVIEEVLKRDLWQILKSAGNFLPPAHTEKLRAKFQGLFPKNSTHTAKAKS